MRDAHPRERELSGALVSKQGAVALKFWKSRKLTLAQRNQPQTVRRQNRCSRNVGGMQFIISSCRRDLIASQSNSTSRHAFSSSMWSRIKLICAGGILFKSNLAHDRI